MPRIRTIKPKFWNDVKIGKLSRDARLIYVGMWNFADDNGTIIGDHTWLKSNILPFDELKPGEFKKWIDELIKTKRIIQIDEQGETFFHIPSFRNHQVINRPNYEEAFIEKSRLEDILQELVNNQGGFTESSVQEGNGKEGNGKGKNAKAFIPPTLPEVEAFFKEKGYQESLARRFFDSYSVANAAGENWVDSRGNKVRNWKQKAIMVWMKDNDKLTPTPNKNGTAESIRNF